MPTWFIVISGILITTNFILPVIVLVAVFTM